jgi:hypothetical protein
MEVHSAHVTFILCVYFSVIEVPAVPNPVLLTFDFFSTN